MAYQIFVNDAWVAPEKAHVSVKDIGFLRGYGIFDFFRIMDGQAIFMSDHLDRFLSSAQKMGIQHGYSKADLADLIGQLALVAKDSCLGVKLVLTGGDSLNGFEPMEGGSNLFVSEVIATAVLLWIILRFPKRDDLVSLYVPLWIFGGILLTSSTAFANPAITIGRVFTTSITGIAPESILAFIIAQIIGAAIGLLIARNITNPKGATDNE